MKLSSHQGASLQFQQWPLGGRAIQVVLALQAKAGGRASSWGAGSPDLATYLQLP